MVKLWLGCSSATKGFSSFQAFAMALSGRIGTGSIAGVATAITMGGPVAVFWMWLIAFLGSASASLEATLGQIHKEVKDGPWRARVLFVCTATALMILITGSFNALHPDRKQRREEKDPEFHPGNQGIKRAYFLEKKGIEK